MTTSPAFVQEMTEQLRQAEGDLAEAMAAADETRADQARGRIADLRELHDRALHGTEEPAVA